MWMPVGQAIGVRPNVLSSQTIPNTLDGVGPRARAPRSRRIPEALRALGLVIASAWRGQAVR